MKSILPISLYFVLAFTLLLSSCSKQEETQSTSSSPAPVAIEPAADSSEPAKDTAQETAPPAKKENLETTQEAEVSTTETTKVEEVSTKEPAPSQESQLTLARKSGCLACHAIDKKVIGPPWQDVATRYQGDPNAKTKLINKVSKGGRGNWTDVVGPAAMPPYSPRVSDANIEKLVDFILSLKK